MATTLSQTVKPGDVGLKRELGLISAMWSSETSIIGSGWLLASFGAAQVIGGAAIMVLAAGLNVINVCAAQNSSTAVRNTRGAPYLCASLAPSMTKPATSIE